MICACGCGAEVVQKLRGHGKIYATDLCKKRAAQRRRNANPTTERVAGRKATYAKYNAKREMAKKARRRNIEACRRYRESIKALPAVRG